MIGKSRADESSEMRADERRPYMAGGLGRRARAQRSGVRGLVAAGNVDEGGTAPLWVGRAAADRKHPAAGGWKSLAALRDRNFQVLAYLPGKDIENLAVAGDGG